MKDRIPGAPGRFSAVVPNGEYPKMQRGEVFAITLTRDDKPVVEGTPYSKAAVLPDEVAEQLCPGVEDPTPADAFRSITEQVGNRDAIYSLDKWLELGQEDCYWDGNELVESEGCDTYVLPGFDHYGVLQGKKIKIITYTTSKHMECRLINFAEESIYLYNENVNIAENPESGIWEIEVEVPVDAYDAQVRFPFEENDYLAAPVVMEVHADTVWEGLKDHSAAIKEHTKHIADRDNPHGVTIEQLGAAPAGYGLGERQAPNGSWGGYHQSGFLRSNVNSPDNEWWYGLICKYYEYQGAEIAFRRAVTTSDTMTMAIRNRPSNTYGAPWNEWEYVNPPLISGVEYRTVERWLGKPVYTKLISLGALPDNDVKYIANVFPAGAENVVLNGYAVASVEGTIDGGMEYMDIQSRVDGIWATTSPSASGYIGLQTSVDRSNYTAYVIAKYTKSTD